MKIPKAILLLEAYLRNPLCNLNLNEIVALRLLLTLPTIDSSKKIRGEK